MNSLVPPDVAKTVERLRAEGRAKLRLADELESHYTGEEPKRYLMMDGLTLPLPPESSPPLTVDRLIEAVREKGGRVGHLATRLNVSDERIRELVEESNGKLYIPDWRGWVKLKHK